MGVKYQLCKTVCTSDRIESFGEIIGNAFHDYIHPSRPRGGEILHLTMLFNQGKKNGLSK